MTNLSINIADSLREEDPQRRTRIQDSVLNSAENAIQAIGNWHRYLAEQIHFPLQAMIISADSTARVTQSSVIKCARLASLQRCYDKHILMVGYGPFYEGFASYYFMEDMQQVEADIKSIEAILDYRFWLKYMI